MATQFVIPNNVLITPHLIITIDREYHYDEFKVKVEAYATTIPKAFIHLFSLGEEKKHTDDYLSAFGLINRRQYSPNIGQFCSAFEKMCGNNIDDINIINDKVVYRYIPLLPLKLFVFENYQQDEFSLEFNDKQIKIYLDGNEIPEVFGEITKTFGMSNIVMKQGDNSRIFVIPVNPELIKIKELVQAIVLYLSQNNYIIVNVDYQSFAVDMRSDASKSEAISIEKYCDYLSKIDVDKEPDISLDDLFSGLSVSLGNSILGSPKAIEVESVTVS
jgi:hypothetical protein